MSDVEGKAAHGFDKDAAKAFAIGGEEDHRAIKVLMKVWDDDPGVLDWVRFSRSMFDMTVGDITVTMGDVERLLADNYWNDIRVDNTSGNIDYIAKNITHKAAVGSATWYIWKYSDYDSGLARRIEGPLVGTYTGRAALSWA